MSAEELYEKYSYGLLSYEEYAQALKELNNGL